MPASLLLRGGLPWGQPGPADILIADGRITAIGPALPVPADAQVIDLAGHLVVPGLVNAHCHLDKTLWSGPWVPHDAPPGAGIRELIAAERRGRARHGIPDVERMTALLEQMAAFGTTHVRSHTDVDPEIGLAGIEAVLAAAERLTGRVDVEIAAFPQSGILGSPGTADLLEQALKTGATTVGGLDPAGLDRDPVRHLDTVFALAARHAARVDIHLHDTGTLGLWQIELITERTTALGLQGRVAISHAFALGEAPGTEQRRAAELLATAGVSIHTCAGYNDPLPPLTTLTEAGVTVALGTDGIRDLWGPYGSGDLLERATHLAARSSWRTDTDLERALHAATYGSATALGLDPYGLHVGTAADVLALDAGSPAEAVATHPERTVVIKGGRVTTDRRPGHRLPAHDRRATSSRPSEPDIR